MDPLIRGHYPESMRRLVGSRLPQFTSEQSELIKGAFDFIGLNYYTANYAANLPPSNGLNLSYSTDSQANLTGESMKPRDGFRSSFLLELAQEHCCKILKKKIMFNNTILDDGK